MISDKLIILQSQCEEVRCEKKELWLFSNSKTLNWERDFSV